MLVGLLPRLLALPPTAVDRVVETVLSVPGTPEADGSAVTLDATLLTTDPAEPRPAIVLAHGLGRHARPTACPPPARWPATGTPCSSTPPAASVPPAAWSTWTTRRTRAATPSRWSTWPAGRPEVEHSVGTQGNRPGARLRRRQLRRRGRAGGRGLDPRIDAIVPAFTYADLTSALVPQHQVTGPPGVARPTSPPTGGTGVLKAAWAAALFTGTASAGSDAGPADGTAGTGAGGRASSRPRACAGGSPRRLPGLPHLGPDRYPERRPARADPALVAATCGRIAAPTLMIQGEDDTLFGLDQADRVMRGLPASTRRPRRPGCRAATTATSRSTRSWTG